MLLIRECLLVWLSLATMAVSSPLPGGSYHHVHHRIHVPQKIKTIYHTKIIKVPEHHHHFHEKEKIIIEKEKAKEEHHPTILQEEEHHDWSEFESSNLYKKKRNAHHPTEPTERKTKKKRVASAPRHPYPYEKP